MRTFPMVASTLFLVTAAVTAETTGTPACDDYLKQFATCVKARAPAPEKEEFLKGIDLARAQYRRMTSSPYRPDVASACIDARKSVFAMLSAKYGCSFD